MLTATLSRISAILARLPPYSGIILSTRRTSAPSATRRRANAEPIKPRPPVITALAPLKASRSKSKLELTFFAVLITTRYAHHGPERSTLGSRLPLADNAAGSRNIPEKMSPGLFIGRAAKLRRFAHSLLSNIGKPAD